MKLWELFVLYLQWHKRKTGKEVIDLKRECGYFFPVGLIGYPPKEREHMIQMQSGKLMITKLLNYELYHNPNNMIKWAEYQYIGYENETKFADMTWPEYREAHYGTA